MTIEAASRTKILLKARPTQPQLEDRLRDPVPDGLELYLDRLDLLDDNWLDRIRLLVPQSRLSSEFVWIVEAPIRTLGGTYFDLTANDTDHRETLRRVIQVGAAIGAAAANVHVVAPTTDTRDLSGADRARKLEATFPVLEFYVTACIDAGMVPQVENIPPVGRMREGAFVFSPIGTTPGDLLALADAFPTLRFTVDLSHAALALNWKKAEPAVVGEELRPVAVYARNAGGPALLGEWLDPLVDLTTTVHVSNASGLLGEGLAYGDGDEDLDAVLRPLIGIVHFFVTETLEANPDNAMGMRDAQRRLLALRAKRERESR